MHSVDIGGSDERWVSPARYGAIAAEAGDAEHETSGEQHEGIERQSPDLRLRSAAGVGNAPFRNLFAGGGNGEDGYPQAPLV